MKKFPPEFEDILNEKGKNVLKGKYRNLVFGKRGATPIEVVSEIIDPKMAENCIRVLNRNFYDRLSRIHGKIDSMEIKKMRKNYSEKLGKTLRMKSIEIKGPRSLSYQLAHDCGLLQMLSSDSLRKFGEIIAKQKFGNVENNQLICYEHGDYVSPHNDHHPENKNVRNGYFDLHIMFSNTYVQHQFLVYEKGGFLNGVYDLSAPSGATVYKLPFWHYTTPLFGKVGKEKFARRWLILRSFEQHKGPDFAD